MQPGDVVDTYASVENLNKKFNYKPSTPVIDGISNLLNGVKIIIKNDKQKKISNWQLLD